MYELLPFLSGIGLAFIVRRRSDFHTKVFVLGACSVTVGMIASFISGELYVSGMYLLIDTALVLLAAGVTMALTSVVQRWVPRRRYSGEQSREVSAELRAAHSDATSWW
jgi:hypothetical protein